MALGPRKGKAARGPMKNFLSSADLAIWMMLIAGQVILCLCIFEKNVLVSRVRSRLRLKSVLQAATCGAEKARESEDIVGRSLDVGAGSCVPDGGRSRCTRAYLQTQSSLPGFWPAKDPHLPARRALLVPSEGVELRVPETKDCTEAL